MAAINHLRWFYLLCYLLATTSAQMVELRLEHDIEQFNASSLVPRITGAPVVEPLGPVKVIPFDKKPRFFPITFDLWTREGRLSAGAQPELLRHNCHLMGQPVPVKRRYEFNLTQLMPPLNPWSPHRRTYVLLPGFKTETEVDWMDEIRRLWLELEDVNVIQVYWTKGNSDSYNKAVTNTKIVARQISMLLYYLAQIHGQDFSSTDFGHSLHFVGHSLGAHIAGFVGQELGGRVGRITGLDPAGPEFDDLDQRLDAGDAHMVDAFHTNVGKLSMGKIYMTLIGGRVRKLTRWLNPFNWFGGKNLSLTERYERKSKDEMGWYGLGGPVGHLDYYANDGSLQPGCDDELHICDHHRASLLYIGFLQYELAVRRAYNDTPKHSPPPLHTRLAAFPSTDYAKLMSSHFLARNCPRLLQPPEVSKGFMTAEDKSNEFRRCSMPIDVVASGPQFKRELEQNYGLPLPLDASHRLYFLTTNQEPYVAEQHLMQLHLTPNKSIVWSRGCRLTALFQSSIDPNLVSLINYEPTILETVGSVGSLSLVLPFASPVDWRYYQATPETIHKLVAENRSIAQAVSLGAIEKFLPGNLEIKLTHMGGTDKQIMCQIHIDLIETRPMTALNNFSLSLFYGQESSLDQTQPHFKLNLSNTRPYLTLKPVSISL